MTADPQTADWPRTLRLAAAAFVLALAGVGIGGSSLVFLWKAYQHGGL